MWGVERGGGGVGRGVGWGGCRAWSGVGGGCGAWSGVGGWDVES